MENPFDQAAAFGRMWMDFASNMAKASMSSQPSNQPFQAARQTRGNAFQAMAEFYDQFLRSPFMLECMKQSMDTAMAMRRQFDEAMTQVRQQTQGVASEDVDNLMRSIRHMEERVLDRMDDLSARMDRLSLRLDTMEANGGGANGHSRAGSRISRSSAAKAQASEAEND